MGNRLEGKVAVVTGAGRGIGRGIALLMAQEGARVVVNDYGVNVDGTQPSEGPAAEVAEEIRKLGGQAVPNFDTVATVEGGERIIKTALDAFGRLDILVNVAGILRDRMIFNMTPEEWDAVIAVHLKGHFCTTKPASIIFRQQRYGRIINFSSTSGLIGNAGQANYGAAKAAEHYLAFQLAAEEPKVTCFVYSPGTVDTDMQRQGREAPGPIAAMFQGFAEQGRLRSPEETARALVRLLQNDPHRFHGRIATYADA